MTDLVRIYTVIKIMMTFLKRAGRKDLQKKGLLTTMLLSNRYVLKFLRGLVSDSLYVPLPIKLLTVLQTELQST